MRAYFAQFFNVSKSPHGGFNGLKGEFYLPKHPGRFESLVWNSAVKGTYIRKRDGEIGSKKARKSFF